MSKNDKDIPLQEQLQKLDELLSWFEQDDFDIEQALGKYEEGIALIEAVQKRLTSVENRVEVLKQRFDQAV